MLTVSTLLSSMLTVSTLLSAVCARSLTALASWLVWPDSVTEWQEKEHHLPPHSDTVIWKLPTSEHKYNKNKNNLYTNDMKVRG